MRPSSIHLLLESEPGDEHWSILVNTVVPWWESKAEVMRGEDICFYHYVLKSSEIDAWTEGFVLFIVEEASTKGRCWRKGDLRSFMYLSASSHSGLERLSRQLYGRGALAQTCCRLKTAWRSWYSGGAMDRSTITQQFWQRPSSSGGYAQWATDEQKWLEHWVNWWSRNLLLGRWAQLVLEVGHICGEPMETSPNVLQSPARLTVEGSLSGYCLEDSLLGSFWLDLTVTMLTC